MIEFKKGSTTALFGEVIMESVGRSEKEFKLNNPVPAPHIIPICFLFHLFLSTGIKPVCRGYQGNMSGEREGKVEARNVVLLEK